MYRWIEKDGYQRIRIDGHIYRAHRLAFLYMTGKWPSVWLDHEDVNRSNNRWANLRKTTPSFNIANSPRGRGNKSGLKGAYWHKREQKWRAQIGVNRRTIHLGRFDTAEDAHAAYFAAATIHFGKFARAA